MAAAAALTLAPGMPMPNASLRAWKACSPTPGSIVSLRMASGALCQIDSSRRAAYGYDERIEVFGSDGLAESRRQSFRGMALYKARTIIEDGLYPGWFERIEASYYQALDAFLRAVDKGTAPSPSLEDGLKAQLIADKATESLKTGRPVKIGN